MIRTVLDLTLDPKAKEFDCGKCDPGVQALRNCSGKGSPAKIFMNGRLHTRCPMAVYLENYDARYLVNVYYRCRDMNMFPAPGGILEQTAFTIELFAYISGIIAESERRQAEAQANKS